MSLTDLCYRLLGFPSTCRIAINRSNGAIVHRCHCGNRPTMKTGRDYQGGKGGYQIACDHCGNHTQVTDSLYEVIHDWQSHQWAKR
jgi:hypothetical protein